jgi:hypothetical protein
MTNNKNNISIFLHEEENNAEVKTNFEINNKV